MVTKCTQFEQNRPTPISKPPSGRSSQLQSGDIGIRHFQCGGVCLHFTRASFNTIFGKSNFKITLIFSKMTLYSNYIFYAVRYGLVKVSYIIRPIRCSTTRSGFHAEDHFWLGYLPRTFVALSSCRARYFLLYWNLVIVLAIPLRLLRYDLYHFLQFGLCEQAHCHP